MLNDLQHIPLADLKLSKLNVRRHGPKDLGSLAASIAALGLIQPLLVRSGGGSFEIVAGQRRYLAMKRLNAEGAPDTDTLPCVVMEATSPADPGHPRPAKGLARARRRSRTDATPALAIESLAARRSGDRHQSRVVR